MKKEKTLRVRIADILDQRLKHAARESGTTVSGLIRKMIETNLLTKA